MTEIHKITVIGGICLFLLAGCSTKNNTEELANRANARFKSAETRVYKNEEPYKNDDLNRDVEEFDYDAANARRRAENIAAVVTAINGIEKASVVITGNSTIIGIEITGELTDESLKHYKNEVEQAVKQAEPAMDHIAVTAAPEMLSKIKGAADFISGEDTAAEPDGDSQDLINSLTPAM